MEIFSIRFNNCVINIVRNIENWIKAYSTNGYNIINFEHRSISDINDEGLGNFAEKRSNAGISFDDDGNKGCLQLKLWAKGKMRQICFFFSNFFILLLVVL